MNQQLQSYARTELKAGLKKLPEGWQNRFKQMYAGGKIELSIDEVVDNMPEEKLDWAMQQVERSLEKFRNN